MDECSDRVPSHSRRDLLRDLGVLGAGIGLAGCGSEDRTTSTTSTATRTTTDEYQPEQGDPATVSLDPAASASDWTIDARIFGKFFEFNGRDGYPGLYSDHVSNGSFEVWNGSGPRASDIFAVSEYPGIPYPWEPLGDTDGHIHMRGGVHGRTYEKDLEVGDEVPSKHRPQPGGVEQPRFQRIKLDGSRAGVQQLTALPDRRTTEFVVSFSVRGRGVGAVDVGLYDGRASESTVLARQTIQIGGEWERHEVTLSLDSTATDRYGTTPFGTLSLGFGAEGSGHVDLDFVMLRAGDAVAGKFNPTTIDRLREFSVTSIRWPGGNFASQYHWRDGVGPLADRPVVPIGNWGGLERNYLGTNEFLEFCEITDVEPLITVGSWTAISPEEAAKWVEYCNGDPEETEMGALRAEHGHPDPWNVSGWQVGNEVWGRYQIGHQAAEPYAERYEKYYEAMKPVDSRIEVDATGIDPMYTDFDDGSYEHRNFGTPPRWNDVLFDTAGESVDGVDIHRYSRGIVVADNRERWLTANDEDSIGYNEVLTMFPSEFGNLIAELAENAERRGADDDLRVNVGEWNLQPRVHEGWPRAGYPTMAHAAYCAGIYNAFIRQGNVVKLAYQRDNTLFYRPYPRDCRPVNPGNYVQRLYASPFADRDDWRRHPVSLDGPTRDIPQTGIRIRPLSDVPYVDAAAIRAEDTIHVFVVNRDLHAAHEVSIDVGEDGREIPTTKIQGRSGDPFARQTSWEERDGFTVEESTVDDATVSLPPAGVARLTLER